MKRITIASGKGGTGKTFLSTNLFRTMEAEGLKVAMVDCDAEVPNDSVFIRRARLSSWKTEVVKAEIDREKCTYCGRCAEACRFNAITCVPSAKYVKIMTDICHGCGVCGFVCPEQAIVENTKCVGEVTGYGDGESPALFEARTYEGQNTPVPVIRHAIKMAETSGVDYLILDAPPGCSCPFVNTVMGADLVILITEPTPFGLSDLKHTVAVLRQLKKSFHVVINRADLGDGSMKAYLKEEKISLLAEIPYAQSIASCYACGEIAVEQNEAMKRLFVNLMKRIV